MSLSTLARGRSSRLVQRAATSACSARILPKVARNGVASQTRFHEHFGRPSCLAATPARHIHTSPTPLAIQQFKLADIGEGIAEVQLTEWYVKVGDKIKEMDNIAAVESDKASVELTSPYTGTVKKLHFKLNDQVKVGSVLIDVETAGGAPAQPAAKAPAAAAPAASGTATQTFKLADIGEGIAEVQLTEWFVKVGDKVKEMDNLAAVESDKASVELTSPYTGTVTKLHAKVNDTVKVGAAVCDIETAGGGAPAATQAAAPAGGGGGGGGGVQTFNLSDIGEGIAEVQVTEVFVKEGDMVKEFDNLFAVESDKASVELPSPFTGKVKKIHHQVNDTVKVGAPLIDIETAGGAPAAAPAAPASPSKSSGALATPKVKAFAKAEGVDLSVVKGTGPAGRITKEDVVAYKASYKKPAAAKAPAAASAAAGKASPPAAVRPAVRPGETKVVQITDNVGKGMVKSMVASLEVPYMALGEEIDITELVVLQKALKEGSLKKYGTRPTITTFLLKAISLALDEHPIINSKFGSPTANPPEYTMYGSHNISVAIDSPHGLVVPNIKDVGNMSLIDIQNDLLRLAVSAQNGKLAMGDITGGTITFSNVGTIGTKDPRPILFDGQAVIGAAGRTMSLPRYNDKGELTARQIMNVRWVGDHRHLDGATLARFSNSFKRYCENPGEWLLAIR